MLENSNTQLIKEDIEQNGIYKIVMREFTNNNARSAYNGVFEQCFQKYLNTFSKNKF